MQQGFKVQALANVKTTLQLKWVYIPRLFFLFHTNHPYLEIHTLLQAVLKIDLILLPKGQGRLLAVWSVWGGASYAALWLQSDESFPV